MKNSHNQDVGQRGEDEAVEFLKKQGYKILERNFKKPQGDIDIVALDGGTLVFIEVKTRRSHKYGLPIESITPWKIRELIQSAHLYKFLHPNLPESLRIDVVAIDYIVNPTKAKIELIKNITL